MRKGAYAGDTLSDCQVKGLQLRQCGEGADIGDAIAAQVKASEHQPMFAGCAYVCVIGYFARSDGGGKVRDHCS
jgi:hypothetical protein